MLKTVKLDILRGNTNKNSLMANSNDYMFSCMSLNRLHTVVNFISMAIKVFHTARNYRFATLDATFHALNHIFGAKKVFHTTRNCALSTLNVTFHARNHTFMVKHLFYTARNGRFSILNATFHPVNLYTPLKVVKTFTVELVSLLKNNML